MYGCHFGSKVDWEFLAGLKGVQEVLTFDLTWFFPQLVYSPYWRFIDTISTCTRLFRFAAPLYCILTPAAGLKGG
jgi:hypothetical protein